MAHSSQKGAVGEKIANIVFLADPLDLHSDLKKGQLNLAQKLLFHLRLLFA